MKKILLSLGMVVVITVLVVYQRTASHPSIIVSVPSSPTSTPPPSFVDVQSSVGAPPLPAPTSPPGQYRDGAYTSAAVNSIFGNVQVQAVIQGGRLVDVIPLQFPNDRPNSIKISQASLPQLKTEAIAAQSAQVDVVSGATQTSEAFSQSLAAALAKAKAS